MSTAYAIRIKMKQMIDPCCAIQNPNGAVPTGGRCSSIYSRNKSPHPKLTKNQIPSSPARILRQARE